MKQKMRIGIIFGGRSAEHEVSLVSARNVVEALDKNKYEIVLLGIDKKGGWHYFSVSELLEKQNQGLSLSVNNVISRSDATRDLQEDKISHFVRNDKKEFDVIFPILHGPYGEDGTIQGLLKLMGLPFVGASVLGSAVGMDKDVMKRLCKEAGLPIVPYVTVHEHEKKKIQFKELVRQLGLPLFVKPANAGSSIGVAKVHSKEEFLPAVEKAFLYDRKILFEKAVRGREVECSVLGNEEKVASLPGEILATHEFYDYEAKYIDEAGATLEIPAKLPKPLIRQIQKSSIRTCDVLGIEGMSRVDFFVTPRQKIYINEVNTIPGFTNISMYPKLWEASGISYPELIDRLIQLAIERHENEQRLRTSL